MIRAIEMKIDKSINENICVECEDILKNVDARHFDLGVCSRCGQKRNVMDPLLFDLYRGLDLDPAFVHEKLPRLRAYPDRLLSMVDIGVELSRHTVIKK